MSTIANYYLLCTIAQGGKALILNQTGELFSSVVNSAELELYTKKIDGKLVANETIVGGEDARVIVI